MIIEYDIPQVALLGNLLQSVWLQGTPWGRPIHTADQEVLALEVTFLRLVESTLLEYQQMGATIRKYFDTSMGVDFYAVHAAISHAEVCVTNMHRAARLFNRLLRRPGINRELATQLSGAKFLFRTDEVTTRLGNIRNAIHHIEDKLLGGEIASGEWVSLAPTGPETSVSGEPGQTIKTIDRLSIGSHAVTFHELAAWLAEMRRCASLLVEFRPSP